MRLQRGAQRTVEMASRRVPYDPARPAAKTPRPQTWPQLGSPVIQPYYSQPADLWERITRVFMRLACNLRLWRSDPGLIARCNSALTTAENEAQSGTSAGSVPLRCRMCRIVPLLPYRLRVHTRATVTGTRGTKRHKRPALLSPARLGNTFPSWIGSPRRLQYTLCEKRISGQLGALPCPVGAWSSSSRRSRSSALRSWAAAMWRQVFARRCVSRPGSVPSAGLQSLVG